MLFPGTFLLEQQEVKYVGEGTKEYHKHGAPRILYPFIPFFDMQEMRAKFVWADQVEEMDIH